MIGRADYQLELIALLVLLVLLVGFSVALVWQRRRRPSQRATELKLTPEEVEFENHLLRGLRHQGYSVEGSQGPFLAIRRGGETTLVSYRNWTRSRGVGARVAKLERAMALQGAAGGKLVTDFKISKRLEASLPAKSIDWIGPDQLHPLTALETRRDMARDGEWITSYTPDPTTAGPILPQVQAQPVEEPSCPRCGSPMGLQTASSGAASGARYWRCVRAPECRGVRAARS